ncbi:PP0621 family protein [Helicobacter heilmannii]|uniref:PP0621 family protein n=1 Tax=Helicobacter heilmannii TaxID=35817 RepID=UPI000CF1728C|nr:PP0621 family protein [Helicobacter heilmannii]
MRLLFLLAIVVGLFLWLRPKMKVQPPKNDPNTGLDMLECAHCKTYVTPEEAVYAKGCVYCSKACLNESAC